MQWHHTSLINLFSSQRHTQHSTPPLIPHTYIIHPHNIQHHTLMLSHSAQTTHFSPFPLHTTSLPLTQTLSYTNTPLILSHSIYINITQTNTSYTIQTHTPIPHHILTPSTHTHSNSHYKLNNLHIKQASPLLHKHSYNKTQLKPPHLKYLIYKNSTYTTPSHPSLTTTPSPSTYTLTTLTLKHLNTYHNILLTLHNTNSTILNSTLNISFSNSLHIDKPPIRPSFSIYINITQSYIPSLLLPFLLSLPQSHSHSHTLRIPLFVHKWQSHMICYQLFGWIVFANSRVLVYQVLPWLLLLLMVVLAIHTHWGALTHHPPRLYVTT